MSEMGSSTDRPLWLVGYFTKRYRTLRQALRSGLEKLASFVNICSVPPGVKLTSDRTGLSVRLTQL